MSVNLPPCPSCGSDQLVKNGKIDHGKQNLKCLECSRQFVQDRENKVIEHATKELIELISCCSKKFPGVALPEQRECQSRGCKAMSMPYMKQCPNRSRPGQKKGRLVVQCDEMWSFVGHQGNKQWVWLALDLRTREIVGVYVGDRSREGAQG